MKTTGIRSGVGKIKDFNGSTENIITETIFIINTNILCSKAVTSKLREKFRIIKGKRIES